jgi:hypothetical protein
MLKKEFEWKILIEGIGLERVVKSCQNLKKELFNRYFKFNRNPKSLVLAIRLEHLQIKKHQKIAMRYLFELEQKIQTYENRNKE